LHTPSSQTPSTEITTLFKPHLALKGVCLWREEQKGGGDGGEVMKIEKRAHTF